MASPNSIETSTLYKSPIPPLTSNLRIVENRIIIDAPHTFVFDFVSTWSNLGKWLPMTSDTKVLKGEDNVSAKIGDVLYEGIKHGLREADGEMVEPKVYTVVVRVPGLYWGVAGTEEGRPWYRNVALFSTFPLEGGDKTLFVRVIQQTCRSVEEPVNDALDPGVIQGGLEVLKKVVEDEYSSR